MLDLAGRVFQFQCQQSKTILNSFLSGRDYQIAIQWFPDLQTHCMNASAATKAFSLKEAYLDVLPNFLPWPFAKIRFPIRSAVLKISLVGGHSAHASHVCTQNDKFSHNLVQMPPLHGL